MQRSAWGCRTLPDGAHRRAGRADGPSRWSASWSTGAPRSDLRPRATTARALLAGMVCDRGHVLRRNRVVADRAARYVCRAHGRREEPRDDKSESTEAWRVPNDRGELLRAASVVAHARERPSQLPSTARRERRRSAIHDERDNLSLRQAKQQWAPRRRGACSRSCRRAVSKRPRAYSSAGAAREAIVSARDAALLLPARTSGLARDAPRRWDRVDAATSIAVATVAGQDEHQQRDR
jgi:hypothetical protein